MPKEVTTIRYQTDDGRYFDTMREAERHETRTHLIEMLCGEDWHRSWRTVQDVDEAVDRVIVNAPALIRLLQRFVEPTEAV